METETKPHPNVSIEERSPDAYPTRTLTVDLLVLDRENCDRCRATESSLRDALDRAGPLLADLGVEVGVRIVTVESEADARRTRLDVSPTIRIDGRDLQPEYVESVCESYGELRGCDGVAVDCRDWTYRGEEHATAPVGLLLEGLLRAALAEPTSEVPHVSHRLSENLRRFFEGPATPDGSTADRGSCC